MDGDVGADVGGEESVEQLVVVDERLFGDGVAGGLDAGPLHAEAVVVEVHRLDEGDVFVGLAVAAHRIGDEGALAEPSGAFGGCPGEPVGGGVLVFNLCGSGRCSEGEGAAACGAREASAGTEGERAGRRELRRGSTAFSAAAAIQSGVCARAAVGGGVVGWCCFTALVVGAAGEQSEAEEREASEHGVPDVVVAVGN